ncbi:MAG: S41 family peptidase [Phycisphaeraceae bacterium]|nr:S41 family peptidase [Phycisphaeraceae bacterium]MCW5754089.1 S41 family peptidase [Phycisphaeraceae bacterium]
MKRSRLFFDVTLVSVLGVAVLGATMALARRDDQYRFFDPLLEIKVIIDNAYVVAADDKKLQEGAIRGLLEALDDPYTTFVPAEQSRDFQKDLTGEYVGIGASVNVQNGWLTIVSPLEDSPAYRSGLMADDRIVEIEGESTYGLTVEQCVARLVGVPGTSVRITVERKGERFSMDIVRDHIKTRSVKGFHRDPLDPEKWQFFIDPARSIAYIRLVQFTPACAQELRQALDALNASRGGVKGLILDLRNNPGGVLDDAVDIADMFLSSGRIVSTSGRARPEQVHTATSAGTYPDFPMIVMLNGASASASEVLAGALADNNRAIVLGSRSFGKGSVQGVIPLRYAGEGAQLKITEQYYYLPSGRLLHRRPDSTSWGVDPTPGYYIATSDQEELDMFLARREQEVIRSSPRNGIAETPRDPDKERWDNPEWIVEHLKDRPLAAAIRAMQARLDHGEFTPTGEQGIGGNELALIELRDIERARERFERELERLERRAEQLVLAAGSTDSVPARRDLWPDAVDVTDGVIKIFDKDGNEVTTLRITSNRLERWLIDAGVEPIDPRPADAP